MASFEKPQEKQDVQTSKKPHEIQIYVPDKEHMKRHDLQEKKDHELAAMLQAQWAAVVQAEHNHTSH